MLYPFNIRRYLLPLAVVATVVFSFSLQATDTEQYFDAGSMGKTAWSPSTNEVQMALWLAEYYGRYMISDERKVIAQMDNILDFSVQVDETANSSALKNRVEKEVVMSDEFHIAGLHYRDYQRLVRTFLQPYGETVYRVMAIQHIPLQKDVAPSDHAKPFTIYFNATNGKFGNTLGLPAVLYSPGPPFSFHKKGVY